MGVRERGSELHVDLPEAVHAGYTQNEPEVEVKTVVPNVIPAQFSITAISRRLQPLNALLPIDVTLLGILTDAKEVQPWNALPPIDVILLGILTDAKEVQP